MKYYVNENCIGCGLCSGVCPEVFSMTEAGVAQALTQDVPAEQEALAEAAMNDCPVQAIEQQ